MSTSPEPGLVLCDLPHSVLLHVFSFLRIQDLINCVRQTCKLWYNLSFDRFLWKHLDLDHIGDQLTDQSFLTLLDSVSNHVEKLDFGMAVHLTDVSFAHKDVHCPYLKSINFSLTTVSNASISYIVEKYPDLEKIEINDCSYINIYYCFGFLASLKKLRSVSFDDFGCSAEPERLNQRLKELFLSCPKLEHIVIDSEELSDDALASLFASCPNLKGFVLAHCQYISSDAFAGVSGKLTSLVNIGLAYTPVDDKALKLIAEASPNLSELDITGCIHVTDIGIGHIAENCSKLEKLIGNRLHHEGGCNITNVGLSQVAAGCPNLRILDVNFCAGVTDSGIIVVAEHCPKLSEIGLSGCIGITDTAVIALAEHCPWLYHVNLTECIQITSRSISLLLSKCQWLNNLSLETCHYLANVNMDKHLGDCKNMISETKRRRSSEDDLEQGTSCSKASEEKDLEDLGVVGTGLEASSSQAANPSGSSHSKFKPTVQTFSTYGSSLCMNVFGEGSLSFAVPPLFPLSKDSETDHTAFSVDPSLENWSSTELPQTEEDELVEVASINRFTPHPNHSHLTSIHLSFCSKIANDSVKQLAKHCPDLMYVSLRGCYKITDTAVEVLVRSCQNLHFLDISGGSTIQSMKLTNCSLIAIANYSKSLRSLMICRNKLITLDGMQRILQDCQSLIGVWVTVGDKLKITFSGILELVKDIEDRYVKITNTSQVEANGRQGNLCISLIPKKTPFVRMLHP